MDRWIDGQDYISPLLSTSIIMTIIIILIMTIIIILIINIIILIITIIILIIYIIIFIIYMTMTRYFTEWAMTIFTRGFSFDLVTRVWDVFLNEGIYRIYRL